METKWTFQEPKNEMDRIPSYAPGTPEREALEAELAALGGRREEIPLLIGGRAVETGDLFDVRCPHDHARVLARAHLAGERELSEAVETALAAQRDWAALDGYQRAAVFSRAADLISGPRRIACVAAIMANQSKTPFEAEIDLIELIDFWRFNVYYMQFLYGQQPNQSPGELNRFDWRPLEGFVLAISPFNFFAIGGNLPTAPALAGNVSLWKPARSVLLSNHRIMQALVDAGLPAGVINFVPFSSRHGGAVVRHPALAGLHFTGSYEVLVQLWQEIGQNLTRYKNFPRVVGETGGKDFIVVHPSAEVDGAVANAIRGAFEYQGQKCSAASRMYAPESLWPSIRDGMLAQLKRFKVGPVEDLGVGMGAIITEDAFDKIADYLDHARRGDEYEIVCGGTCDKRTGYFVDPTVVVTRDPNSRLICEEIFGPVLTVYVYPDAEYADVLARCDATSPYALTGAVFARDRTAIRQAEDALRFAAGNFYINDKPTGAIVGRQPFGGARHSGTNDKAGFWLNLARWMSPRAIKESLVSPSTWERPYLG